MSQMQFSRVRTGKRIGTGGTELLKDFKWNMGENKRLIIPTHENKLMLYGRPIHRANGMGRIQLARRDGSKYGVATIRCTHPYSQETDKEQLAMAKTGEVCLFCDLAKYEDRKRAEKIREEFGDKFSELTTAEQKEFYQDYEKQFPKTVDKSYFRTKDGDQSFNQTTMDMYLLVLEVTLTKEGNVKLDDKGVAEIEPVLMSVSQARLLKFSTAITNSLNSGQLEEDMLTPIIENEGTEYEEEVLVGWVDFLVSFPVETTKMQSGKNMTVTPIAKTRSVVSDGLKDKFSTIAVSTKERAENLMNLYYKNLQVHTRKTAMEMIKHPEMDGEDYFNLMQKEYRQEKDITLDDGRVLQNDDSMDKAMIATVIERAKKLAEDEEEGGKEGKTSKDVETSKPSTEEPPKQEKTFEEMTKDEKIAYIQSLPEEVRNAFIEKQKEIAKQKVAEKEAVEQQAKDEVEEHNEDIFQV